MTDWTKIKHFKRTENWGDPDKIDPNLIMRLEGMRIYAGKPFIIHCGYELEGHKDDSYHGYGKAVDGHFVGLNLIDQFLIATRFFGIGGIGMYGKDVWTNPGLHLDTRPYTAHWCYTSMNGKAEYSLISFKYLEYLIKNKLT